MIVTFCTYDSPTYTGGPNSWLRRLLPKIISSGIDVQVLFFVDATSPQECSTFKYFTENKIQCKSFPFRSPTEQKISWILSILSIDPPDVFVPNMLIAPFYASRWVKESGIATIGVLHSDDEFHHGILKEFVFGHEAYRFSALVCVSEFLKQHVLDMGNTTTKIEQIPCGVPIPINQAQPPLEKLRLIYVGRLEEEQKRILDVARSLCQVLKVIPDSEAIIYGEGSAEPNVTKVLEEYGKGLPIILGGMIRNEQIQDVMLDAHILVLLSDYEGLPIALLEAMSCGLVPICLSTRSGISELVEDGVTGLIVNDRGDDFVNAVKRLRNEPNLWRKLSSAARTKVLDSYSSHLCTEKWLNLLHQLKQEPTSKKTIQIPSKLKLPPCNSVFAREDFRQNNLIVRSIKKLKQLLYLK
jgi:colanic acid/amylovoran biosynthesis glycosyltransferase